MRQLWIFCLCPLELRTSCSDSTSPQMVRVTENEIVLSILSSKLCTSLSVTGIEYRFVRVPVASCDFSTRLYTYADTPGDYDLQNFTLAEEDIHMKVSYTNRNTPSQILGVQCWQKIITRHLWIVFFCAGQEPWLVISQNFSYSSYSMLWLVHMIFFYLYNSNLFLKILKCMKLKCWNAKFLHLIN